MSLRGLIRAVLVACAAAATTAAAAATPAAAATTPPPTTSSPTPGALSTDGPTGRYLLGGSWLYEADPNDIGVASGWWQPASSTAGWATVTVPNSYNAGDFSSGSMAGYVGWYRRDFTVPAGAFPRYAPRSARGWLIDFESVNYQATVWLNGHRLGSHTGAYLPFELNLTPYLRSGVNHLVVRVDDRRTGADLPPGPGGGWWNFGGLLDVVYMRPVERAAIEALTIDPSLSCTTGCPATIAERATVRNPTSRTQTVRLVGSYGGIPIDFGQATLAPGAAWSPHAIVHVPRPRLWSPGRPNLYRATLMLTDTSRRSLGGYAYLSGIRSVQVTRTGRIELNGRLLDLRGVNLHEQDIGTGAALTVAQMRRRIGWVKSLGATIIRAHYPLDPELEEMADRTGVLLWSEVPVYQVADQYLGNPSWVSHALSVIAASIAANRDHPSILLWSVGNELPTPATANETAYIRVAAAEVRHLDPSRPVGMAVSDWPGVPCQPAYGPLDVIGVNEYFGWFDAGGGTTDDRDELSPFLDSVRACYPRQALFVSEFGFNGNRQGPADARGTYAFQEDSIAYHLGVFARKRWLSGAIYFNLQDFAARPGYDGSNPVGTPPFVTNGLLDVYGNRKGAFAVAASMFRAIRQIGPAR